MKFFKNSRRFQGDRIVENSRSFQGDEKNSRRFPGGETNSRRFPGDFSKKQNSRSFPGAPGIPGGRTNPAINLPWMSGAFELSLIWAYFIYTKK